MAQPIAAALLLILHVFILAVFTRITLRFLKKTLKFFENLIFVKVPDSTYSGPGLPVGKQPPALHTLINELEDLISKTHTLCNEMKRNSSEIDDLEKRLSGDSGYPYI